MIQIVVSDEMHRLCPEFVGVAIAARVENNLHSPELWKWIDDFSKEYRVRYSFDSIKMMPAVRATREAYKRCGKDPSRYRPSGEALCRRILRGLPLYQINTLVDLINVVSIATGYSIGGFDADLFEGNLLTLGIGTKGELYEGIGRGLLNIDRMPVYRDRCGGVGTPTSDNERTKLSLETTKLLTIINGYSGHNGLGEAVQMMQKLLKEFVKGEVTEISYF